MTAIEEILEKYSDKYVFHFKKEYWGFSLFIMENNGKAFCTLYWYSDEPNILYTRDLSVSESSRRKGFASEILKMIEQIGIYLNINKFYLTVQIGTWMLSWYERLGFRIKLYADLDETGNFVWMEKIIRND